MRLRTVVFSPEAQRDLLQIHDWIAERAGIDVADYLGRLEAYCLGFEFSPQRGRRCDDIRHGLRIVGFERRITIAFTVGADAVTVLRLYYAGRNWSRR